jgi:hypothetical protein
LLGALTRVFASTVYHELDSFLPEEELQEVKGEARKPVAVHDHNLRDAAPVDAVQKGTQAGPLEVDPGGDVGEEAVSRVRLLELVDLALEVTPLLGGGDAGVDDATGFGDRGVFDAEPGAHVGDVVEAFPARRPQIRDESMVCPGSKG